MKRVRVPTFLLASLLALGACQGAGPNGATRAPSTAEPCRSRNEASPSRAGRSSLLAIPADGGDPVDVLPGTLVFDYDVRSGG